MMKAQDMDLCTQASRANSSFSTNKKALLALLFACVSAGVVCTVCLSCASLSAVFPLATTSLRRAPETRTMKCGVFDFRTHDTVDSLFKSYAEWHTCERLSPDASYLVFVAMDGLGNRMLGLTSALLQAILTSKVLIVRWPKRGCAAAYSDLFETPFIDLSWPKSIGNIGTIHSYGDFVWTLLQTWAWTGDLNIRCSDSLLSDTLTPQRSSRFTHVKTNQYYAALLLNNPSASTALESIFGGAYFAHASRVLFQPIPELKARIHSETASLNPDNCASLQMRSFGGELTPERIQHFVSAAMVELEHNKKDIQLLVVSDSTNPKATIEMVKDAANTFGSAWNVKDIVYFDSMATRDSVGGIQQAVVEMFSIGTCKVIVNSGDSTFGYVSSARLSLAEPPPKVVVIDRFTHEAATVPPPLEPCFHFYNECKNADDIHVMRDVC